MDSTWEWWWALGSLVVLFAVCWVLMYRFLCRKSSPDQPRYWIAVDPARDPDSDGAFVVMHRRDDGVIVVDQIGPVGKAS